MGQPHMSVLEEIKENEAHLRAAILRGDVDALDRLISPLAIYTNQLGQRVTKDADIAAYRSGLRVATFDLTDEMIIRHFGDTAIVSLVADVAGSFCDRAFSARLAYTRVWGRRKGSWLIEAAHSSAVAEPTG